MLFPPPRFEKICIPAVDFLFMRGGTTPLARASVSLACYGYETEESDESDFGTLPEKIYLRHRR
jgi:hypothetical protein